MSTNIGYELRVICRSSERKYPFEIRTDAKNAIIPSSMMPRLLYTTISKGVRSKGLERGI